MIVQKDKYTYIFYILIPLLTVGISLGYTTFSICLAVLFFRLFLTNKDTAAFYLFMFGGIVFGITRLIYPFIPLYGIIAFIVAIFLARRLISSFFKENFSSLKYMFVVYIVFIISYLYAEPTSYANEKILNLIKNGTIMLFSFYVYAKSKEISNEHLAQLTLLTVLVYITYNITAYKLSIGTLFDYDWYRAQNNYNRLFLGYETAVNYQIIGVTAVVGFSFILSQVKNEYIKFLFYFIICFHLVMFSGARQAILGILVVVFMRFSFFNESKNFIKILYFLLAFFLLYSILLLINSVGSEHVASIDEGGNGRDVIYLDAIRLISEYPLLGVGLGGFDTYSKFGGWPHNVLLEIICETGFVGFFIIILVMVFCFIRNKMDFRFVTSSNNYYYLIVVALAVRYMISSDLRESVELFSAFFAISVISNHNYHKNKYGR